MFSTDSIGRRYLDLSILSGSHSTVHSFPAPAPATQEALNGDAWNCPSTAVIQAPPNSLVRIADPAGQQRLWHGGLVMERVETTTTGHSTHCPCINT